MPRTATPRISDIPREQFYASPHPPVVAAMPQVVVKGKKFGTDKAHRNYRPSPLAPTSVFIPRAPSRSVRVLPVAPVEPNPFEGKPVESAVFLLNNDAFHLVGPEIQKWAAELITLAAFQNTRNWQGLSIEAKASVARLTMEWYREPGDMLGASCQSIHSGNIYYVQYLPASERVVCTCKAKGDCFHKFVFNEIWLPKMLERLAAFTESASSELESVHRQGRDAESNEYNRERINEEGDNLRTWKEFD